MATRDLMPEVVREPLHAVEPLDEGGDDQLEEFAFSPLNGSVDVATDAPTIDLSAGAGVVTSLPVPSADDPAVRVIPPPGTPSVGSTVRLLSSLLRERVSDLRPRVDRRTALRLVGQGVSVVGMLLLALGVFEGWVGALTERRDQRELRGAFDKILSSGGAFAPIAKGGVIPPGTPVASIEIPKLGLRKIVAEGTTSDDLRKGPGHLRSTPLPGQHGNAVIAGRRTTYGAPFRGLDRLVAGDVIAVTTPFGEFRYLVRDVEVLAPGESDRLGATSTDNLTLTTSDPPYRANRRLVVVAELDGKTSGFPDPLRQTKVGAEEGSFFGDASKAVPAVLWELAVFASLIGARALYGRWRRWPTYLLTTPVIGATTFAWLESMVALLPSTL